MIEAVKLRTDWKEVIARARELAPDAFDLLVDEYAPRLRGFLRRTVPGGDVDDLVQEVFLRMVRTIAQYREEGRLDAWVFQIARNLARDRLKKRGPNFEGDLSSAAMHAAREAAGEGNLERVETTGNIENAIARLPGPEREVVLLRHFGKLSFEEIAELMETPLGTALARAHRGLAKLREWMEDPNG